MKLRDLTNVPITSFDIIGDIAIVWVPDQYMDKAKDIAQAITKIHKRVRAVYRKNPVEGTYRTRKLELIYGTPGTETITKENGILLKLDVEKVFYSPRMSTDRLNIAKKIKPFEHVLVPFAGVGPYALLIAKMEPTAKVVGIELNPVAVSYFKENIKLNKLSNVTAIEGDASKEMKNWRRWADRIIMPIPMYAEHFLKDIREAVGKKCYIYVYLFVDSKNPLEEGKKKIEQSLGMKFLITDYRKLRSYSKDIDEYVFEVFTSEDFSPKEPLRKAFIEWLKTGKGEKPNIEYKIWTPDQDLWDLKRTSDFVLGIDHYKEGLDYVISKELAKKRGII